MFTKLKDGTEIHIQITPGGIAVLNARREPFYRHTGIQKLGHLWARKLVEQGTPYRPIWCLHVVNASVMNVDWVDELSYPTDKEVSEVIGACLREADEDFDLHLYDIFRRALCLQNFQSGLSRTLLSNVD